MFVSSVVQIVVALLIEQLGHNHYHHREVAQKALHSLVWIAPSQVERATKHWDAEIAHRATRIYRPMREIKIRASVHTLCNKFPWLSTESEGFHSQIVCQYVDRAREIIRTARSWVWMGDWGNNHPDYCEYRLACRLWATDRLLAGDSVDSLRSQFARMQRLENNWLDQYVRGGG